MKKKCKRKYIKIELKVAKKLSSAISRHSRLLERTKEPWVLRDLIRRLGIALNHIVDHPNIPYRDLYAVQHDFKVWSENEKRLEAYTNYKL